VTRAQDEQIPLGRMSLIWCAGLSIASPLSRRDVCPIGPVQQQRYRFYYD
jgi:hypothetical protein